MIGNIATTPLCISSLHTDRRPAVLQVRLLIGGVVLSRFGLWMFDMAVTQLVQERVLQEEMGE